MSALIPVQLLQAANAVILIDCLFISAEENKDDKMDTSSPAEDKKGETH